MDRLRLKDAGGWKIVCADTGRPLAEIFNLPGQCGPRLKCVCKCHKVPEHLKSTINPANYCRLMLNVDIGTSQARMLEFIFNWIDQGRTQPFAERDHASESIRRGLGMSVKPRKLNP